jgi:uncharacterized membrane protein
VIEAKAAPDSADAAIFLGEGPSGPRYVEGVLQTEFRLHRVYAGQAVADTTDALDWLTAARLIVLSDYPSVRLGDAGQSAIVDAVIDRGVGLLMIGGWASFGAPNAGYRGTPVAGLLPVEIGAGDDRTNTPIGTVLVARDLDHAAIRSIRHAPPCAVVGFNHVTRRTGAEVLVDGYCLAVDRGPGGAPGARLIHHETPMLSVWQRGRGRVAAIAPDLTPHWAGGILDWGDTRVRLPTGNEVGPLYQAFLIDLCRWLIGK